MGQSAFLAGSAGTENLPIRLHVAEEPGSTRLGRPPGRLPVAVGSAAGSWIRPSSLLLPFAAMAYQFVSGAGRVVGLSIVPATLPR